MQDIKFSSNNPGSTTLPKVNFQVFQNSCKPNVYLTVVSSSEETFKLALFLSIVLLWVWVTMKQRLIIVSEKMNMDAGGVKKEKP